ncbi:MAG: hypothetical protein AAGD00_05295 [Planctomycetota bacterium]
MLTPTQQRSPVDPDARETPSTPSDPAIRERLRSTIVRDLPHEDRLFLVLWYAEGLSAEEIAELTHQPIERVFDRHDRLVSHLRERAHAA